VVTTHGDTRLVAEESGMHQVLLNLATNALHAMEDADGGTLTLAVRGDLDHVTADVSDTGVGISPADRQRLFEPFFTTRGPSGTGLGLAVSYGIVVAHGGRLDVVSEPGRGSTFTVTLPRRSVPTETPARPTQEETA
jgi:signal transduction histidine kinase